MSPPDSLVPQLIDWIANKTSFRGRQVSHLYQSRGTSFVWLGGFNECSWLESKSLKPFLRSNPTNSV